MATVSNPATMSSVAVVFGGPGNLAAYVRGGTYVPIGASSTISTTVAGLRLSQFNGVTNSPAMTAAASPTSVSASTAAPATITTGSSTATPTGGTAPYTYLWSYNSGDTTVSINGATTATASFTATVNGTSGSKLASFVCKITDNVGNVAYTGAVAAHLNYTGIVN